MAIRKIKTLIAIGFLAWCMRHILIFPTFDETTITGFEFRIRF